MNDILTFFKFFLIAVLVFDIARWRPLEINRCSLLNLLPEFGVKLALLRIEFWNCHTSGQTQNKHTNCHRPGGFFEEISRLPHAHDLVRSREI